MQESRSLSKRVYICPTEFLETVVKESRNTTMWDSVIQTRSGGRGGGGIRPNVFFICESIFKKSKPGKTVGTYVKTVFFKNVPNLWG